MTAQYPPLIHGRHQMQMVLDLEPLGEDYQQEWLRDAGFPFEDGRYVETGSGRNRTGKKSLWASMADTYPLMHRRFPRDPQFHAKPTASIPSTEPVTLPSFKRISTVIDGGKGQSFQESSNTTTDEFLRARVGANTKGRFHPDFLVVKTALSTDTDQYVSCLQRGLTFLDTPKSQQMCSSFVRAERFTEPESMATEDVGTLRFCDWINAILTNMLGPAYTSHKLFHWKGNSQPDGSTMNPDAHPWGKKDLAILKQGRPELIEYGVDHSIAGGEVKRDQSKDMSSKHLLEQNLKTHAEITSVNPIAPAVRSLTLCKTRLRLWQTTPLSLNSSRLIDVVRKEHHKDMLQVLLFLACPSECVLPSWQPPNRFPLYDVVSQRRSPYTWYSTGRLLYARPGPCGNHTSIWEGTLEKDGDLLPGCFKGSMLPLALVEHEYRILELFRDQSGKSFPNVDARTCQRLDLLSTPELERTLELIPQVVGVMPHDDPGTMDPVHRSQAGTQPDASLHLAALVFKGQPELKLSARPMSIVQSLHIFADIVRVLWYSACLGIDYRDINLGNVMKRLVVGTDSCRGVLIDFGNAVYGRLPRDPNRDQAADLRDDGRSANIYFMTLNTIAGTLVVDALEEAEAQITKAEQQLADAVSVRAKVGASERLDQVREDFRQAERELKLHKLHGYTDNLESLVYCFVTHLDRLKNGSTDHADKLGVPAFKETLWHKSLEMRKFMAEIGDTDGLDILVSRLTKTIKECRDKTINAGLASGHSDPCLTDEEDGCFRDCLSHFIDAYEQLEEVSEPA